VLATGSHRSVTPTPDPDLLVAQRGIDGDVEQVVKPFGSGTASGSHSSNRGANVQMTKFGPWKVWWVGGGGWKRPAAVQSRRR
jgi:hypothetical protein